MKTRPAHRTPDRLRINFVSSRLLLIEKVSVFYDRSERFAVVCSGVPLPDHDLDGYIIPFEAITAVLHDRERPRTRLPVMAYGPPSLLSEAFTLGCRDYLKEPWELVELDIRLNMLFSRERPASVAGQDAGLTVSATQAVSATGRVALKPNEARILQALLRARGEVVSREVLYYAIWGKIKNMKSRVVDVHICALRKKLSTVSDLKIEQVRGEGYILI